MCREYPYFSLILCTLGRYEDVLEFARSLVKSNFRDYEVIVVDQNKTSRLEEPLRTILNDVLIYNKVEFSGLSKARNYGINIAKGEYICFPDDDCIYQQGLLYDLRDVILAHGYDFYSVNTVDPSNGLSLISKKSGANNISLYNRPAVSFTLFFHRNVINTVGLFDELLGVGSGTRYGAGEESDYVVRALIYGFSGYFLNDLYVFHPVKEKINSFMLDRNFLYGGGYAYFLQKHRYVFGSKYVLYRTLGVFRKNIMSAKSIYTFLNSISFTVGYFLVTISLLVKCLVGVKD